jgi:hypothetical protein
LRIQLIMEGEGIVTEDQNFHPCLLACMQCFALIFPSPSLVFPSLSLSLSLTSSAPQTYPFLSHHLPFPFPIRPSPLPIFSSRSSQNFQT